MFKSATLTDDVRKNQEALMSTKLEASVKADGGKVFIESLKKSLRLLGISANVKTNILNYNCSFNEIVIMPEEGKNGCILIKEGSDLFLFPLVWDEAGIIVSLRQDAEYILSFGNVSIENHEHRTRCLTVKIDEEVFRSERGLGGRYVDGDTLCQYLAGDITADDVLTSAEKEEKEISIQEKLKELPILRAKIQRLEETTERQQERYNILKSKVSISRNILMEWLTTKKGLIFKRKPNVPKEVRGAVECL